MSPSEMIIYVLKIKEDLQSALQYLIMATVLG